MLFEISGDEYSAFFNFVVSILVVENNLYFNRYTVLAQFILFSVVVSLSYVAKKYWSCQDDSRKLDLQAFIELYR